MKYLNIEDYMKILTINNSKLSESEKEKSIIGLFCNNVNEISKSEGDEILNNLGKILNNTLDELLRTFTFDGVEYGFIPNLEEMSAGEYIDLDEYLKEGTQLDRIMAILYRPITKKEGDLYEIEPYEGTSKYYKVFRQVDFRIVLSAMVFFSRLERDLLNGLDIYIQKKKIQVMRENRGWRAFRRRLNFKMSSVGMR